MRYARFVVFALGCLRHFIYPEVEGEPARDVRPLEREREKGEFLGEKNRIYCKNTTTHEK